ncbi:MAG: hypothetical protein AAF984_10715 [Verrucomicrobiota bacterium]
MKHKQLFLLCFLVGFQFLVLSCLFAQEDSESEGEEEGYADSVLRSPHWYGTFRTGSYWVRLVSITSVSMHDYLVDGAMKVSEVTIDTTGATTARFYVAEEYTPESPVALPSSVMSHVQDRTKDMISRAGQDELAYNTVIKNYPQTTHAKTVEFRLADMDELDALYKSVVAAFRSGKGRSFKIVEDEN